MKISLGFSPCPNDTFLFDALVNGRLDTDGLCFEPILADVEALNRQAAQAELMMTKLSYHAYYHVRDQYQLLSAGSALGRGCGPLLVCRADALGAKDWTKGRIGLPGAWTTAQFLLRFAYPQLQTEQFQYQIFSSLEQGVLSGELDAAVLIHEGRFTYAQRGLHCLADLGQYWETQTQAAIPLGGIALRRDLAPHLGPKIAGLLKQSLHYAWANPQVSRAYVAQHAQELSPEVQAKHIDLYVNKFTADLGSEGRAALQIFFDALALQEGQPKLDLQNLVIQAQEG